MLQFLDIIIDNRIIEAKISHKVIDSVKVVPKPAVPDTTQQDTAQVISGVDISGNMQQLADIAPDPSGLGEMLGTNMMLAFLVVLFALGMCCYFVMKYRNSHSDAV